MVSNDRLRIRELQGTASDIEVSIRRRMDRTFPAGMGRAAAGLILAQALRDATAALGRMADAADVVDGKKTLEDLR